MLEIKMTCFHISLYILKFVEKLRTMCGKYSESARNFAFFSEKSCPAVITVATNITSGLDIMSYVSKDVRLGYEIGKLQGESRNLNIIIQSWQVAVA